MIIDKDDEIVDVFGSLMTGVAQAFQKQMSKPEILTKNECQEFINSA